MKSSVLLVVLLCMLYTAEVQTDDSPNALKLCGRAFLRAVVFTCGGSRWRRLMAEEADEPRGPGFLKVRAEPGLSRLWRDQNQALISACCQQGCERSDLSRLC